MRTRWAAILLILVSCSGTADSNRSARPSNSSRASVSGGLGDEPLAGLSQRKLAFTWGSRLMTARADGSERRVVGRVPGAYGGAHWSAAARAYVVRVEKRVGGGNIRGYVFKVSSDGQRITNLSQRNGGQTDGMVAWAPDGRSILFISLRGGDEFPQLYVMRANGRDVRRITDADFEVQYPQSSPDGSRIAFTAVQGSQGNNFDLYTVAPDGSDMQRLTDTPDAENWPTWSPDSTRIAFFRNEEIWSMAANGSDEFLVTHPENASGGEPNWSPDGELIAFDCIPEPPSICAIRPDGSGFTPLFERAGFPFWIE
jgi:Tol biopolymer transport system component